MGEYRKTPLSQEEIARRLQDRADRVAARALEKRADREGTATPISSYLTDFGKTYAKVRR